MDFGGRLGYLIFGILIGFVLGYFAKGLRDIRTRLDETDAHVKSLEKDIHHDDGFFTSEVWNRIALLIVIGFTVWASIVSQISSNAVEKNSRDTKANTAAVQTQSDQNQRVSDCTASFLLKTSKALNARTAFTSEQADANRDLQKAQANFLGKFIAPARPSQAELNASLVTYFKALTTYLNVSSKTNVNVDNNPYPKAKELQDCLEGK